MLILLLAQARSTAESIIANAQEESRQLIEETEKKNKAKLDETDRNASRKRRELDREDDRLQKRREDLDKRFEKLEKRENTLNKRQSHVDRKENEVNKLEGQKLEEIQRIAQMTIDEARVEVLAAAESESRNDMARIIRQVEAEAREQADSRARDVISLAVQRLASEHISDISVSIVPLPSDEMKGRIIGRNGRNIRSFEMAAGVDVVVDDTPEAITISSFDPIRREVARQAMTQLVTDGRIHPARIEKLVKDAEENIENTIREYGENSRL